MPEPLPDCWSYGFWQEAAWPATTLLLATTPVQEPVRCDEVLLAQKPNAKDGESGGK